MQSCTSSSVKGPPWNWRTTSWAVVLPAVWASADASARTASMQVGGRLGSVARAARLFSAL
eukprot:1678538-Lingulodinium_polyedra.AAC.1